MTGGRPPAGDYPRRPSGCKMILLFVRLDLDRRRLAMTDEDRQRQMDFILNQQAEFTTDIHQLQEAIRQTRAAQAQTDALVARLAAATFAGFTELNGKINILTDAQIRSDDKVSALAEAQARTDGRLNVLISTVERYVSGGRNGAAER
jgi:hypothetical protein